MERKIIESISIGVQGKVSGFRYDGETIENAAARCILTVEQAGNNHGEARLHLELRPEYEPLSGQSQFSRTIATDIQHELVPHMNNTPTADVWINEVAGIIDRAMENLRDSFAEAQPCPLEKHPGGICYQCVSFNLKQILELRAQ